jgi:biopolymer transport protein ExbB
MRLIFEGGAIVWIILLFGSAGLLILLERFLFLHRAQINLIEFLNGVKNVLKRENILEAISICDATPGPVPQVVRTAIINRNEKPERLKEILKEFGTGQIQVLEGNLPITLVISQITSLLGLLGTVLGIIDLFQVVQQQGFFIQPGVFAEKMWKALGATAVGLSVALICFLGHSVLTIIMNKIITDMEKAAIEIVNFLSESNKNQ